MRFPPIRATPLAVLVLGLALPSAAASQTAPPSDASPPVTLAPAPRPAAPRAKPRGPLFIRLSGGFGAGDRIINLTVLPLTGFTIVAGVAFPIAHREDMEIQVDVSYHEYSGGWYHPGGSHSLAGRAIGPTALYLYNFVRKGWGVMPFVGGGVNLAHVDETQVRQVSNPFFGQGTFESRTTTWAISPQAAGGAQFGSQSRVTFRVEGRLDFDPRGPQFRVLGGISF